MGGSSFSEAFIRRPVATSLISLAILLGGAVAFRFLPVAPLPQVDFPTINVYANLPGASPETMASSVATPLERQFGHIAGVKIWNGPALDPAEIQREMWCLAPIRLKNLWAWTPLENLGAITHNYGGQAGVDWVLEDGQAAFATGVLEPPGVTWDAPQVRLRFSFASARRGHKNLSGSQGGQGRLLQGLRNIQRVYYGDAALRPAHAQDQAFGFPQHRRSYHGSGRLLC